MSSDLATEIPEPVPTELTPNPSLTQGDLEAALRNSSATRTLSVEKIVGALITVIVVGTCTWVASTLADTTAKVTSLQMQTEYLSEAVNELKDELKSIRHFHANVASQNSREIELIHERMRQDDVRESHDTKLLKEIDDRLDTIEKVLDDLSANRTAPEAGGTPYQRDQNRQIARRES